MQLEMFKLLDGPKTNTGIICIKCNTLKDFKYFGNASGGKYKNTTCRKCSNRNAKTIKRLYGTVAPPKSDHRCYICHRTKEQLFCPTKPNKSVWSLDHNHATEEFRGWLCHRCNRGIGLIGDSKINAERLVEYLNEQH